MNWKGCFLQERMIPELCEDNDERRGEFQIEEPDICPNMLRWERKHSEISKIKLTKYSVLHAGKKNSLNEANMIKLCQVL